MDIGGNKLKAVQSSLDMINGRIDQTTGLINKANVAVKTAKRYETVKFASFATAVLSIVLWKNMRRVVEKSQFLLRYMFLQH